ncbi:acyltransferase family protein [Mucilaginibacter sp. McL0603]|uniref:acyltransferase family protein n=1 Tax=Mucilaginibacter sp. McL0603 TaxID=3415670 RepID=UPI003CE7EE89
MGVQMFFLLSGFIICWSIPNNYDWSMARTFILKRITRIEPPFIISVILLLVVQYILVPNYKPDWINVLFHFAYLNSFFNQPYLNPVYWTLGIEFQFYLLIAVIFPLINKKFGFLILIAISIIPLFVNIPALGLINVFPGFAIGICLFLIRVNSLTLKYSLTLLILIVLTFLVEGPLQTSATLIAFLILILPIKSNSFIRFFSKISFSLYLTHDIIGSTYVVHLGSLLPKTFLWKAFEFSSSCIISVLFAYLFYLMIEKPFFLLSKKIVYR